MWLTCKKRLRFSCVGTAIFILVVYAALRSSSPTASVYNVMASLPHFRESVDCDAVFVNDSAAMEQARRWSFDGDAFWASALDGDRGHTLCRAISETFAFSDRPLSEEERMFPLAYGLLVHSQETQVFFLLSALYQPQNVYCIAVDGKSSEQFKRRISLLAVCFPNIYVVTIGEVHWGGYEIVNGVFTCLRHLVALDHAWKYYQYRSGVDLPLKTNLEMVRIFKQFNGSSNVEVKPVTLPVEVLNKTTPPLTVWKSGMPGVFSREAANAMVRSEKVRDHLEFTKLISFPDEKLWASILGNPKVLPMPGGFNAYALNAKIEADRTRANVSDAMPTTISAEEPFALQRYWIGWHQTWSYEGGACHGRWVHSSCVFGVEDLPALIRRAELAAHKFYLDTEPAAFFCLNERIRLRALDPSQRRFRGEAYARLPQVQLHNGASIDDIQTIFP